MGIILSEQQKLIETLKTSKKRYTEEMRTLKAKWVSVMLAHFLYEEQKFIVLYGVF